MAKKDSNFSGSLKDFEAHVDLQSQEPGECHLRDSNPGPVYKTEQLTVPSYEEVIHVITCTIRKKDGKNL